MRYLAPILLLPLCGADRPGDGTIPLDMSDVPEQTFEIRVTALEAKMVTVEANVAQILALVKAKRDAAPKARPTQKRTSHTPPTTCAPRTTCAPPRPCPPPRPPMTTCAPMTTCSTYVPMTTCAPRTTCSPRRVVYYRCR